MPKLSLQDIKFPIKREDFPDGKLYAVIIDITRILYTLLIRIVDAINNIYMGPELPTYTVATVPAAADNTRRMIYVSDETGGAVPAFSDGTDWRRVTDRAIIS